jgi:hypothetical protein
VDKPKFNLENRERKGVRYTNTGDIPRYCLYNRNHPIEMFMVKDNGRFSWVEFFCSNCFRKELDAMNLKG